MESARADDGGTLQIPDKLTTSFQCKVTTP